MEIVVQIRADKKDFQDLLEDLEEYELSHDHGVIVDQIRRDVKNAGKRKLDEFFTSPPPPIGGDGT